MKGLDVEQALRDFDLRLRRVELVLAARWKASPRGVAVRPRGRPRGSPNQPKISIGRPLFREHDLSVNELAAKSVLEKLVQRSAKHHARVLAAVVGDSSAWQPVLSIGRAADNWRRPCALYRYAEERDQLLALGESLKAAESIPVDDPELMRAGLALVAEFIQQKEEPAEPASAAA